MKRRKGREVERPKSVVNGSSDVAPFSFLSMHDRKDVLVLSKRYRESAIAK